jgi:hypothetical protein
VRQDGGMGYGKGRRRRMYTQRIENRLKIVMKWSNYVWTLLFVQKMEEKKIEKRHVPLGEHEGHEVSEVQRLGGRPPPRVEVELLPLFVRVQQLDQVPVGEESAAPEQRVRAHARQLLDPICKSTHKIRRVKKERTERNFGAE